MTSELTRGAFTAGGSGVIGGPMHHSSREADRRAAEALRRDLLLLIHAHLLEEGLTEAAEAMRQSPVLFSPESYEVCDNVDLNLIMMEYCGYYQSRFRRQPQFTKRLLPEEGGSSEAVTAAAKRKMVRPKKKNKVAQTPDQVNMGDTAHQRGTNEEGSQFGHYLKGTAATGGSHGAGEGYLLPARPFTIPKNLLQDEESKQLVLQISKEVLQQQNTPLWSRDQNPGSGLVEQLNNVKWSEVIGHDNVKEALEELLVLPIQYPDLYERAGLEHGGTKGVLLTGPPGTGKTLLARALATQCSSGFPIAGQGSTGTTSNSCCCFFFNLSPSCLTSKWRGESEKLVRVLFQLARHNAPSVIFLDEAEAMLGDRDSPGEHEASKRCKSEFLTQLDGLLSHNNNNNNNNPVYPVLFMASTNLPWTLDAAILRRFQRVFNIDLPTDRDREAILSRALRSMTNSGSSLDLAQLVEATRGYSGSDLIRGCSEAKRRLFRKMVVDSRKASRKNHERTPVLRTEDLLEAMKVTKAKGVASEVWWRKKYDHWKGFNEVEQ